jgi:hypothetical protein
MRFKSKAQRRKFAELLVKGEITPDAYERWNRDTGRAELPERVKRTATKRKAKSKTKSKRNLKSNPNAKVTGKARKPTRTRSKARRKAKRRATRRS